MSSSPAMDWRSPLVGFAAACLALAALALIAPLEDKLLLAGAAGVSAAAAAVLALLVKPPAGGSH